jgi:Kef-type K+ transport system membrane component KefB
MFFVLSGAELRLDILSDVWVLVIGAAYIITRSIGKYVGTFFSAKLVKCDKNIQKYLGITLLPQAGVALGMASKAIELGDDGAIVRNITLFAVLVYEIIGPFLTKLALTAAGEIKAEGRKSARDEHLAKKKAEANVE